MNLTRCSNGHFYDKDKFDHCPHCSGGGASDKTMPLNNPQGSPVTGPVGGGADVTMPINQTGPGPAASPTAPPTAPPVQTPAAAYGDMGPTVPVSPQEVAGMNPAGSAVPPTFPDGGMARLDGVIPPKKVSSEPTPSALSRLVEDAQRTPSVTSNEKTVGIYADLAGGNKTSAGTPVEPVVGWLVGIKGSAFGQSFTLKSGKNFIGRDNGMDVYLPGDKSISRQCHAIILFDPRSRKFLVQPGTSRELFYLNDKVVLGVEEIGANDVMTIGKTDLMFIPCCSESFSWEEQIKKNKEEEEKEG